MTDHKPPQTYNGDFANPPGALKPMFLAQNWVNWKWAPGKNGKWTKPPFQPARHGSLASNDKLETWGPSAAAIKVVLAGGASGIGFVLTGTSYCAIDLDDCRDPATGEIDEWAQKIIDRAGSAYVEVTVSGTGLRVIGVGSGPEAHRKFRVANARKNAAVEVYRKATRYITVSCEQIGACGRLTNIDELLYSIIAQYDRKPETPAQANGHDHSEVTDGVDDLIKNGVPEPRRSEAFSRAVWSLAGTGYGADEIERRLRQHPGGIAAKYLAPRDRLRTEIDRCFEKRQQSTEGDTDPDLVEMNNTYAVARQSGKTCVVEFEPSLANPRWRVPVYTKFGDFKAFHDKYKKVVPGKDGETRRIGKGSWWINHPERKQYAAIVYAPNQDTGDWLNLWTGFAYEPKEGDCGLYLDHLCKNICSDNAGHFNYLMDKMAYAVQHPDRPGEVAVVLRGKEGTGKGVAIKKVGALLGNHFRHVTQAKHLVGHFNAHLQNCSFLFADEAFFAGNKEHAGILKGLITEDTIMIEPKGINAFTVLNTIHLFMSSNSDWVVPASAEARRYFVLDVAEHKMQDIEYFAALEKQMKHGGGNEALLHLLLKRDLSNFNVRSAPQTAALAEQKRHSRVGIDRLIETIAHEGRLPAAHSSYHDIAVTSGEEDGDGFYTKARTLVPDLKYLGSIVLSNKLKDEWGCTTWHSGNLRGLRFLPLDELRKKFDERHGKQDWPEADGWERPADKGWNGPDNVF
jgi:hypothetical protein